MLDMMFISGSITESKIAPTMTESSTIISGSIVFKNWLTAVSVSSS